MNHILFLAIFATVLVMTSAQAPTTANPQTPCSSRFESAVISECFTASGVNFTGVLYIISGNTSGALPAGQTYATFLQHICSSTSRDKVIPCILGQMNKHNTSQCSAADRSNLFGRGGQLLAFLEALCRQPCEQESSQSLIQCFSVTAMHPERLLSQNASITDDRFSIIGLNETEIDSFCKNRQKLFSCLSPLPSTCPGLTQKMYAIGIDLQALETATGFLCSDKQKYLKGLQCFAKPSPEVTSCSQNTTANMRTAFLGRYQTGTTPPSKYQESLCKIKITQITCELAAYSKACDADVTSLRTSVECSMLPQPCRENNQAEYRSICEAVTTPSPVQPVRPTQGRPGVVPVAGASSDFAGVKAGGNAGTTVVFSLVSLLLAFITGLLFI